MLLIQQNDTSHPIDILMVSSTDHVSPLTGATLTVTLSKNGAAFAAAAGAVAEIGSGIYKLTPTAADTGTLGELAVHATATGGDPSDQIRQIVAFNPYDLTRLGLSALPNAAPNTVSGLRSPVAAAGTAQAGAASSITLAAGSSAVTDFYQGDVVQIISGTGAGQARTITGYNGSTLVATVSRAWATQPDATSVYAVLADPFPAVDTNLAVTAGTAPDPLATAVPGAYAAGTAGNIIGNVATVSQIAASILTTPANKLATDASGRVTVGSIVNGAIAAATFAANALDAVWSTVTRTLTTDPWATSLPGSYASGTAGNIVGNNSPSAQAIADAVMDAENVETGLTFRQWLRLTGAVLLGKTSGSPLGTVFRAAVSDVKVRVTSADDVNGNRTSITYDPT